MSVELSKSSIREFFDTKEIMKLVIQKLSSQVLIYSIAIILFFLVSYTLFPKNLYVTGTILGVFLVSLIAYLFFEQKTKLQNEDPKVVSKLLSNRIDNIRESSSTFRVRVWTVLAPTSGASSRDIGIVNAEKTQAFSIGDNIVVCFSSTQSGYLTLLNIGTSGRLTILFPNSIQPDNSVTANTVYTIPAPGDNFEYRLQGPAGVEKLKAIVTKSPVALVESQFDKEGALFRSVSPNAAARDIATIKTRIGTISDGEWAVGSWEFKVS